MGSMHQVNQVGGNQPGGPFGGPQGAGGFGGPQGPGGPQGAQNPMQEIEMLLGMLMGLLEGQQQQQGGGPQQGGCPFHQQQGIQPGGPMAAAGPQGAFAFAGAGNLGLPGGNGMFGGQMNGLI